MSFQIEGHFLSRVLMGGSHKSHKSDIQQYTSMHDGNAIGSLDSCGIIEGFSFECQKVIGFVFAMPNDWLKKLAPIFHPIRSKTKTNCDLLACVFRRFASATCNYFEF